MSNYTMAQIVSLTGIKSHTLRKWESRYNFLEPLRTETNIRYYTDEQLKKLLNISILTRNGFRISKINEMSETELHNEVSNILLEGSAEDEISALILSVMTLDEDEFDKTVNAEILKTGLITTITGLIYPFLAQIGVLWGVNKVMPAQEHFISNLIRQKIFTAIELLPKPLKNAPKAVLFLPENEHHEIGLLLASFIAQKIGWRVYYLGQNVPDENINMVTEITNPDVLVTMFITHSYKSVAQKLKKITSEINLPLIVSGYIEHPNLLTSISNSIHYLSTPEDFVPLLKTIAKERIVFSD
ncbi:MerR family transcriptional regulator [Formosa sediminum]|uniref:MerR family transcriptional regulator n=1 Tax=Formosa sediminum TaxID=2594004 RepID=A0A516GN53_9FLAO|nr:MerR family transcriptional regulator [Formosa sediminum]QDO92800.1 MerR family transcriptional regulator [Formosa sediminum]